MSKKIQCGHLMIRHFFHSSHNKHRTRAWHIYWAVESAKYHLYSTTNILYGDIIMGAIASQITSLAIVYSIVYSDADQRKHQSSASLAFVRGIRRSTVNSPNKGPVTRKMFPFDDVMACLILICMHLYMAWYWSISISYNHLWCYTRYIK